VADQRLFRDALTELGVPEDRCAILPLGYSPEILEPKAPTTVIASTAAYCCHYQLARPSATALTSCSRRMPRAFRASDPVCLVLKDYGVSGDRSLVSDWDQRQRHGHASCILADSSRSGTHQAYRGADVFLAPYRGEGFGMKVLDASRSECGAVPDLWRAGRLLAARRVLRSNTARMPVGDCYDRRNSILRSARPGPRSMKTIWLSSFQAVGGRSRRGRAAREARPGICPEKLLVKRVAEGLRDTLDRFVRERHEIVDARQLKAPSAKKITVVIPTYTGPTRSTVAGGVQKAVAAAETWEMIVVDDGSSYDVRGWYRSTRRNCRCNWK